MSDFAPYRHRQEASLMLAILLPLAGALVAAGIVLQHWAPMLPAVIVLLLLITFRNLTVEVDGRDIALSFGPGWVHRRWPLREVQSCQPVRNQWWFGWGIRWIGFGRWLFNVSGLDAVEVASKNGRFVRIGTDEPQRLNDVIQDQLSRRPA